MKATVLLYAYEGPRTRGAKIAEVVGELVMTQSDEWVMMQLDILSNVRRDDEGDICRKARFEITHYNIQLLHWPMVFMTGHLKEFRLTDKIQKWPKGSYRYVPEPDPAWVPRLVEVQIYPFVEKGHPDE